MKNWKNKRIISSLVLTFIFAIAIVSILPTSKIEAQQNQSEYTVLAPLPGTTSGNCNPNDPTGNGCKTTLQEYLPGVFNLAIGISAAFAVVMIVVGGFQYMSTDAFQGKEDGKKRIQNAIKGLFLVIGAYLILYTINPNLLELNLTLESISISRPEGGGTVRSGGLQPETQEVIAAINLQCRDCNINNLITSTTGGSHTPGSAHYEGRAIDIAPSSQLNQFIMNSSTAPAPCQRITKTLGNRRATFLWEPRGATCGGQVASTGDHWHMSVTP